MFQVWNIFLPIIFEAFLELHYVDRGKILNKQDDFYVKIVTEVNTQLQQNHLGKQL